MIQFIIALGPGQIAALRYIAATQNMSIREALQTDSDAGNQFLSSTRRLRAERLIVWHTDGKMDGHSTNPKGGPWWEVTRKGKLVLEIIDIEIDDHQETVRAMLAGDRKAAIQAPKRKVKK